MKDNMERKHNRKSTMHAAIAGVLIMLIVSGLLLCSCASGGGDPDQPVATETPAQNPDVSTENYRVLHIMSYHSPWEWTDDQLDGFEYALRDQDVEYKVFQMDTKRKSDDEWIEQVSQEAKDLIDSWEPDLVYTNDDNAQKYVVVHYVNQNIPFVFSGVNADPAEYGFVGSSNVTGVLEGLHIAQTLQLLTKMLPDAKRIAIVSDDDATWPDVIERMEEEVAKVPGLEVVSVDVLHTYEEYQQKIKEYQTTADVIASAGVHTLKDENGENVPFADVLKWTTENSNLPDFSFWRDRVTNGTLFGVIVSGYEQGLAAGEIARGILVEGNSPSSYPMESAPRGTPIISLARANMLGLGIDSEILLTTEVVEKFDWEE